MNKEFIQRILVPIDGSAHSSQAVLSAIQIAEKFAAAIYFLHVKAIHTAGDDVYLVDDVLSANDQIAQSIIQSTMQKVPQEISSYSRILYGHPAKTILTYANEINADLLIMGSRGLGKIKSIVLGSVSQEVLNQIKIPVMICK